MNTTLCIDLGNTRSKVAFFAGRDIKEMFILQHELTESITGLINRFQPTKTILSSVVDHPKAIEDTLASSTQFHKLSHDSQLPVTTPVGKPSTIGADRLAIVSAAVDIFPRQHNLSIALGTCITYNFTNKMHEFLGGSISPGLYMRFKAMHDYTALLPLTEPSHNFPLIGYDTQTNLQSGVIMGVAKEIDGIIDAYSLKFNNFNVLLTGGDMPFFVPHLKNRIFADQNLIYKGLYAICAFNNK